MQAESVAETKTQTDGRDAGVEVLTFEVSAETFALEALLVREVLDNCPETYVPGAAAFVDSVINFRGRIIPLADFGLAFGLPATASTLDSRIIVIEFDLNGDPTLIGLRADKVFEVAAIADASTEAAPRLGTRWRPDFIRCLAKRKGEVIVLPNLTRIFDVCGQAAASQAGADYSQAERLQPVV